MLTESIARHARNTPHKPALVQDGRVWTYAELAQRIAGARAELAAQQLAAGSIAVLDLPLLASAWVQGIALRSLGLTTVCVPPTQGLGDLSLAAIASVVTSRSGEDPAFAATLAQRGWRRVQAGAAPLVPGAQESLPPDHAEGGHILMTSGTTGSHKMVLRDARDEASSLPLHAEINGIDAQSVVYVGEFLKLTAGGYRWPLITWNVGGTVVFHQSPDPYRSFQALRMTHAFATPSTLRYLLQAPAGALQRRDELRLLVTGGALPRALAEMAQSRLTRQVFTVLASTEALTLGVTPYQTGETTQWHHIHPARVVQVVDDAGQVLPPGQQGLLRVQLIDGLRGYLDDPAATASFFRDGFFYTGDLGMLASDGRLALRGRATEVINLLGSKLATAPLEQAVQDRLGAEGVCLLTLPDAEGGEQLHLVIQPGEDFDRAALETLLREWLGAVGERVRYHLVNVLPRNHMGKVQRLTVHKLLLSQLASPEPL